MAYQRQPLCYIAPLPDVYLPLAAETLEMQSERYCGACISDLPGSPIIMLSVVYL